MADQLTEGYRRANQALRAATLRDFLRLWPVLDPARMDETFPAWALSTRTLIARDRARAAGLAAGYLKATRLSSGVAGEATVVLSSTMPAAQVETSLSVTARAGYYTALRYGRTPEQARQVALVRSAGAVSRLVLGGGRDTVQASLRADRKGRGWQRVTSAKACDFCVMLAGRGAVYSADTANFSAHDHCSCTVRPVYSEEPMAVVPYEPSAKFRTDAQRDANNAAIRRYLAA